MYSPDSPGPVMIVCWLVIISASISSILSMRSILNRVPFLGQRCRCCQCQHAPNWTFNEMEFRVNRVKSLLMSSDWSLGPDCREFNIGGWRIKLFNVEACFSFEDEYGWPSGMPNEG